MIVMEIKTNKCYNCGACASVCPPNLIDVTDRVIKVRDGCTECGLCGRACPVGAIKIGKK